MKPDYRQELKNWMDDTNTSMSAVARGLGISPTAVSQYINNKYQGDVAKIDDAVRSFLDRQREKASAPRRKLEFIQTSVSKKVFEVAKICHLDGELGVAYGGAGLGKTEAVKEYARQNSDVILIEADLGYTARVLFRELHKRVGLDGVGSIDCLKNDVIQRLRDSGRLIIVDEAEHLPYRALELLRRVYDKAGVGILLVGMPRLVANLRGKKGEYAQLYSRVGIAANLQPLQEKDTENIVHTAIPGSNGLWKAYHESSHGNTRVLTKLIMRSIRVAEINELPLNAEIVRETAKMLII